MNTDAVNILSAQIARGRAALVAGARDLPASVQPLWAEALADIDAAISASEPVAGQVQKVWGAQQYTVVARQELSDALVHGLDAEVSSRLDRAERTIADIGHQLEEEVRPPRPEGISDALILERKREIAGYLERTAFALESITDLMRDSLLERDDLSAFVIAGGPMDFAYRGRVDRAKLKSALYRSVRQAAAKSIPGEQLLLAFEAPHTDETSWTALRTAISGLVGAVASGAANHYRGVAMYSPGWGSDAEQLPAQRAERAAAAALAGGPVKAPEAENLRTRMSNPAGRTPDEPAPAAPGADLTAIFEASKVK